MQITKLIYSMMLVLLISTFAFGASADTLITQYFDKTVEELSGLSAAGVKPTKDWFETQIFTPIKALVDRADAQYNLLDYDDPDDAVGTGHAAFAPADTISITQTGDQSADAISMENNSSLFGTGFSSVIRGTKTSAAKALYLTEIDNDSNIVIANVNFEHDTTGLSSYGLEYDHGSYIIGASRNILFYNCRFRMFGDGIYIGGPADSTNFPSNVIIAFCTFVGDSLNGYDQPTARNGVSITGGSNIIVIGNNFEGFHNVGCVDIEPNAYDDRAHDIVITGNTFNTRGTGVQLSGGDWYNVTVTSNTFNGTNYNNSVNRGIYVASHLPYTQYAYRNLVIADNVVTGMNNTSYGAIGIGGYNKGITIKDNAVFNNDGVGIQVSPSVLCAIEGNLVFDNGRDGIKFTATHNDCTSAAIDDWNMLTDDADWIDIGTPTTNDTSSTYVLADSVSRKLVTDAAGEGLGQVLTDFTADSTETYFYEISAWIFIETASTMTRQVNMTVGGATQVWEQENITGPNSQDGRGWTRHSCIYWPSGTDTLKVTMTTGGGTFYVDSVKVYRRLGHMYATIKDNDVYNNNTSGGTYHGMNLDGLMYSTVTGNRVNDYRVTGDFNDATDDATRQYWGIVAQRTFFSHILNNTANGNEYADLYINDIYNSSLSFIGIENPFFLESSQAHNVSFPYAKALYCWEDSVATTHTAAPMSNESASGSLRFPMPSNGKVVAIAATFSDSVTAGVAKFYPQIGFQVNGSISSDSDKYVTITGAATQKVTYGLKPILTGDVFKFNAGDYLGVSMSTDGSFAPDGTRTATAVLLWE